jgi:hypothetical protein
MVIAVLPDWVTFQPAGTPADADWSDAVKGVSGIEGVVAADFAGALVWARAAAVSVSVSVSVGRITRDDKRNLAGVGTWRLLGGTGNCNLALAGTKGKAAGWDDSQPTIDSTELTSIYYCVR